MAIHAQALPIQFDITGGQVHECSVALASLTQLPASDFTIADGGYDSADVRQIVRDKLPVPLIPRKKEFRHW